METRDGKEIKVYFSDKREWGWMINISGQIEIYCWDGINTCGNF